MSDEDFYEDDEPVADVLAAFETGEKVETRAPMWGFDVRNEARVRFDHNVFIDRPGVVVQSLGGKPSLTICS